MGLSAVLRDLAVVLAIAILTMVATPFVMDAGPGIASRWERWVTGTASLPEPEKGEECGGTGGRTTGSSPASG